MNETAIQIEATDRNSAIDVESLRYKFNELGIEFLKQHDDIYDIDALLRVWHDTRLPEFEILKRLPPGVVIRRLPTPDERLAYKIEGGAVYAASIGEDGDLVSCFEYEDN